MRWQFVLFLLLTICIYSGCGIVNTSDHRKTGIIWQKLYGGSGDDTPFSFCETNDQGFILAGRTNSEDGNISKFYRGFDYWVVKLNKEGNLQWQRTYGGSGNDIADDIIQTNDGGYIIAGSTTSSNGDVTINHGITDYWIVKIAEDGNIEWQRTYGGPNGDEAYSIRQTKDGGYIIGGNSFSNQGEVTGNHGGADMWIVKINGKGTMQWSKTMGGATDDLFGRTRQTANGGYIVAGYSGPDSGDIYGNHGGRDYSIFKLDHSGNIKWQKSLGGSGDDEAYDIALTKEGGYIVTGFASSKDGDLSQNFGNHDYWIVKLNKTGSIEWQKDVGGSSIDEANSITQTPDGGFLINGFSYSTDGTVADNHGGNIPCDSWIIKLTAQGSLVWEKALGGKGLDWGHSAIATNRGSIIAVGASQSTNSKFSTHHGGPYSDFWITKFKSPDYSP